MNLRQVFMVLFTALPTFAVSDTAKLSVYVCDACIKRKLPYLVERSFFLIFLFLGFVIHF